MNAGVEPVPVAPQVEVVAQPVLSQAAPVVEPLSMEEMWMKQQYEKANGVGGLDVMMQQKMQFEALICSEKCKNKCMAMAMGNVMFFENCLASCVC